MELRNSGNMGRSFVSRRANLLLPSAIAYLSQLAQQRNAINLAEGFPDFPAPQPFKDAAVAAINSNFNQYRHVQGLCDKVAAGFEIAQGVKVNPYSQVTICCGQSEALVAAILAVVDEDDEVVLLDPSYETYEASVILAGGQAVAIDLSTELQNLHVGPQGVLNVKHVSLAPPYWTLDLQKLERTMGPQTKAIIVNSPHNPTGKVVNEEELAGIAKLCCQFDCLAITDEVYEHISFTGINHKSLASFPGMQERTIVTSSISKTFSVTGWRIGWAIASETITTAINKIHQKLTDSAPAPFQEAALSVLGSSPEYYVTLRTMSVMYGSNQELWRARDHYMNRREYARRRDFACDMLQEAGFNVRFKPEGSFFIFAELPATSRLTDMEYAAELIKTAGVAVVPGCGFFHADDTSHEDYRSRYIRVAFCKDMDTLSAARVAMRTNGRHILNSHSSAG